MDDLKAKLIRASAGTGKTFALSNRYLALLNAGAPADQILATTFTRKAAGEILDRVVTRLAAAANDPHELNELAPFVDPKLTQERCLQLLRELVHRLHRLQISTLDAFFASLAASFSLELGLPAGWRILEDLHDQYLRTEAIESILRGDSVERVTRLVQLLAKGEAKRSVSDLIRSTVNALYGLFLETNEEAWKQFPNHRLLSHEALAAAIEQLPHVELPKHKKIEQARDNDVDAAIFGDWETFISKGFPAKLLVGETVFYGKQMPEDTVEVYQQLLRHARAVLVGQLAQQTGATYELLDAFHGVYQQLKHNAHGLRFDDVTRSLDGAAHLDRLEQQHFRLDAQLSHLLLDEFQDTSLVQYRVLRPLTLHVSQPEQQATTSSAANGRSFFCVGDVKQAIYGWRGGKSELFDALQQELPGIVSEPLNISYRSSQPVIDTVNLAFSQMASHPNLDKLQPAVQRWCTQFEEHSTAKKHLSGYVELVTAPTAEDRKEQPNMTLGYAARRIQDIVQSAPHCDVGVLVRRNDVVAQLIYNLRQLGVPASEEGGNPLTDSVAVQVILSLMRLADHPGDTIARFHVAQSPLGPILGLTSHSDSAQALNLSRRIRYVLLYDGYGPSVYDWSQRLAASCDGREQSRLQQLVELAFGYQAIATLRTTDFVRYIELTKVADPSSAGVRVMTVHQAKGLQFDIVVLPELDYALTGQTPACVVGQPAPTDPVDRVCIYRNEKIQKLLPDRLQQLFTDYTAQAVSEALCVLYVALTRPIHALHMIVAPSSESERNVPKTPTGLLRVGLTEGGRLKPSQVYFQVGDPHWYHQCKAAKAPGPSERPPTESPIKITLAPAKKGSRPDHQAPSSLEGGAAVPASRLLELGGTTASARGTMIHAFFEQVHWLDDGPPDPQTLRHVARQLNTAGLNVDEQISSFQRMLNTRAIAEVLERSQYHPPYASPISSALTVELRKKTLRAEVFNERRFVVREDDRFLSGIIDRLVVLYDQDQAIAADVIDFKTDAVDSNDAAAIPAKLEFYRPQLDAYRRAVARMFRIPTRRITARLVLVSAGCVVNS
jgi:ATP-dependent exoDNAse (exonuclease V) beta subunit